MPSVQVVGVGKERHTSIGQWDYLERQHTPILLELSWDQWPCAGGLSVVTPLERKFCVRLTRWRFSGADTTPWREAGGQRGAREYAPDSAWAWRMGGLTRDGTAEPVSRDQILRRERGRGKFIFSLFSDHKQDWRSIY